MPLWWTIIQHGKRLNIPPYELAENCTAEWWAYINADAEIEQWNKNRNE